MADANAVSLQNAINRFAAPAKFNRIVVDGVLGPKTLTATKMVLEHLRYMPDDALPPALEMAAIPFQDTLTNTSMLSIQAGQVADYFNYAANWLNYPIVMSPVVSLTATIVSNIQTSASRVSTAASSAGNIFPIAPSQGASVLNSWKRLPTWQKIAIGALAGIGIMWAYRRVSDRPTNLHGVRVHARKKNGSTKRYLLVEA